MGNLSNVPVEHIKSAWQTATDTKMIYACACWQTVCAMQTAFWMIKFSLPVDICKTKCAYLNGYSAWQMLQLSLTAIHCKLNLPGYSV